MNKLSKIIIGIMSAIIVGLLTSNIILVIKLNKKPIETPIDTNTQRVIGMYHSTDYRGYRDSTLTLNKDMTCEYPNENVNCKWSISDDEITLTLTRYLIVDDAVYTDNYYYNRYGAREYKKLGIGVSKQNCEEQIKNTSEELVNARCELSSTKDEKITLVNGGVLINNHIFYKIK